MHDMPPPHATERERNTENAMLNALALATMATALAFTSQAAPRRTQIEAVQAQVLPARALGKAARYTLALWPKLTRFLQYPELELSNNLAENSMRPIALGRKNWIHIGSPNAGPKVAAILSIVESCRRLQIPLRDYLDDVLPGLAHWSIQHLKDRTPAAWASRR